MDLNRIIDEDDYIITRTHDDSHYHDEFMNDFESDADDKADAILKGDDSTVFTPDDYINVTIRDYTDNDMNYLRKTTTQFVHDVINDFISKHDDYSIIADNDTDDVRVVLNRNIMLRIHSDADTVNIQVYNPDTERTGDWKHDDDYNHAITSYSLTDYDDCKTWLRAINDEFKRYEYMSTISLATDDELSYYNDTVMRTYDDNDWCTDDDSDYVNISDAYDDYISDQFDTIGNEYYDDINADMLYYQYYNSDGNIAHIACDGYLSDDEIKNIMLIELRDNPDSLIYNLTDSRLAHAVSDDKTRDDVIYVLIKYGDISLKTYHDDNAISSMSNEDDGIE